MYGFALLVVAVTLLTSSIAQAASYQKTTGTIVNPILDVYGDPHSYSGPNLEPNANLTLANLINANLTDANLTNANLTDANLSFADLTLANLTGANLSDANLYRVYLSDANMTSADLSGSNISAWQLQAAAGVAGVNVMGNNMTGFDLSNLDLTGATLTNATLTNATLTNATLTNATLTGATLTGATLIGANLHQALLPSAMPSLPVINGAVVTVVNTLDVSGSVQVDTGGNLSITSDSFTAAGVDMQGGEVHGSLFNLDLDEIGDISRHGQPFGHVDLGDDGTIAGSGAGLELFGHVSGSGTLSGTTLFGNLNIGSSPGVITLEDVVMSEFATTTFEIAGTDPSQFDQLILIGSVALNGTAQITFDNFTPDLADTFQLLDLTGGTASSWFSSVVAPEGWTLSSGVLLAIPEPSSALLLGIGILCVAGYRRDSLV